MRNRTPQFLLVLAVVAIPASAAVARPPQVQDRAGLYSADSVRQANEVIAQIYDDYGINVLVETGAVPADGRFRSMIRRAWQRFFPNHTAGRSRSYRGDRTIYVRVQRQPAPGAVEIEVGADPQLQRAFPESARAELRRLLLASLKQKDARAGLHESVAFVRRTLTGNLGVPFDWGMAATVIFSFVGGWLFLEALRGVCRLRRVVVSEPGGPSSGAGSLGPALFGMMLRGDFRHVFHSVPPPPAQEPAPARHLWHEDPLHERAGVAAGEAWAERHH